MREADFISLAEMLMPATDGSAGGEIPAPVMTDARDDDDPLDERVAALRDARLFRARLADALDEASARLLRELAADVLARELQLAPCDLASIMRRVHAAAPIAGVRVAPEDAALIGDFPVVVDASLRPGDAIVELTGGAIDARLGVRLAQVLEAFA